MSSDLHLNKKQEQHIVDAIAEAEKHTSGEIRVHLEHHAKRAPLERAAMVFHELGMDETELQNGVLIYIATEDHRAAIYAGKGILEQVEDDFWNDALELLLDHFRKQEFEEGIVGAIHKVSEKLQELFPYEEEFRDELTNEISYHHNTDRKLKS